MQQAIALNVGVDVSKSDFVAYAEYLFVDRQVKKAGRKKFDNTVKGIDSFLKWIEERNKLNTPLHFAVEATGRYHEELAYTIYEAELKVSIVLPNKIKYFARSLNEYSKTDPIDAKIIASYVSKHEPEMWQPANASMRQLREYTRERQDITQSRTRATNRIGAIRRSRYPEANTIERLESQIQLYNDQIEDIETDIANLRREDEKLDRDVKLLTTIPSVGVVTACSILAETGGFALFKNRNQLIKFAGLDIVENRSGSSINGKGKISKRGNAHLRSSPYMGAVGAIGRASVFQDTYERNLEKHGEAKKAISAVIRQILKVALGVYKSRQPYNEEVHRLRVTKGVDGNRVPSTVTHQVA